MHYPPHLLSPPIIALVALHVVSGALCLLLGPWVLLSRPGGGGHRRRGEVFLRLMCVMAVSAFALLWVRFNPFFLVLAVFSFYLAFSGYRVLRRKTPGSGAGAQALDWAAAGMAAAASAAGIAASIAGVLRENPVFVGTILGGTLLVSGYDLHRFWRPLSRLQQPMLWFFEHMGKLIGSYIAVVAAFSATVLTFVPLPWRQLWPVAVGLPLMLWMMAHYRRRFARAGGE